MRFAAHEENFWGRAGRGCGAVGAVSGYAMDPGAGEGVPPDEASDLGGELVEEWKFCRGCHGGIVASQ